MSEDSKYFSLTVWRPSRLARGLAQYSEKEEGHTFAKVDQYEQFHEAVYSWSAAADVWGGIVEPDVAFRLRESLLQNFSPSISPQHRNIGALRGVLAEVRKILGDNSQSAWQDLSEHGGEVENDDVTRANTLIALFHHLSWVVEVFQDIPRASVTIR